MSIYDPTPATPERLATHPEVIAVFVFATSLAVNKAIPISHHGGELQVNQWRAAAVSFAQACVDAGADEYAMMHVGDAQSLRYLCANGHAIVVVLPMGARIGKSIKRAMRVALNHIDNAGRQRRSAA